MKGLKSGITIISVLLLSLSVYGNQQEASEEYNKGLNAYKAGHFLDAAKNFMAARQLADERAMKVKALKKAADCYGKAGFLKNEYLCIESLLKGYPSEVDFKKLVDREYIIGNKFFAGHRDPAYAPLRWIPWLTGEDQSILIYAGALKHAPFSSYAPQARLRLARLYIDDGKLLKAIEELRELTQKYPDSESTQYGYLELANALMQLARYGDGDGAYNREANEVMNEYLRKYPKTPEAEWVKKRILEAKDINAKRLYDLARYYNRIGNVKPAERYLNKVLREYPDSVPVDESEALLSKIDNNFIPLKFRPEIENRYQKYTEESLPDEAEPIIITPEGSKGRWMLPIRDLHIDSNKIPEDKDEK